MTLSRQLELASRKGFVSSCKSFVLSAVIYVRNVTTDTYGKVCTEYVSVCNKPR